MAGKPLWRSGCPCGVDSASNLFFALQYLDAIVRLCSGSSDVFPLDPRTTQGASALEERRVYYIYLGIVQRRLLAIWDFIRGGGIMRSGMLTGTLLAVIFGVALLILHERGRHHLTHIKDRIDGGVAPVAPSGPKPGGMEPVTMTRPETVGGTVPEFASVTTLPGLGMSILQITAYLPGRGEVPLLVAPEMDSLAAVNNDPKAPAPVPPGLAQPHGEIQLPWAGLLGGSPSDDGDTVAEKWLGHVFEVPQWPHGSGLARGGLLGSENASTVKTDVIIDGGSAIATFPASDFGGHWPGKTQTKVTMLLIGSRMELTVVATNAGSKPEPIGIGWLPRFAIGGDRQGVSLRLPSAQQVEMSNGSPTGRLIAADAVLSRFMNRVPVLLNGSDVDATLGQVKPAVLEDNPVAELRFPEAGYGLRMTAVSPAIHAFRVEAKADSPYIALGAQTNYPDPLGKEWEKSGGSEIIELGPGQSVEWRIKLDIFPLADTGYKSTP